MGLIYMVINEISNKDGTKKVKCVVCTDKDDSVDIDEDIEIVPSALSIYQREGRRIQ